MKQLHDFGTPRNLYEKLIRDGEKLENDINGDSVFDFVSTAFHLQHWIKNSPLISSEVVKRLLKRIANDKYIKHCEAITRAKEHFKVGVEDNKNAVMIIGEEKIIVDEFRTVIVALYENYFKQK